MFRFRLGVVVLAVIVASGEVPGRSREAWAAGDATQARCGAQTEVSLGFRPYLPDCRALELVTPPYKEGGVILDEAGAVGVVSADGSHVIAGSSGAFAGASNYWWDGNRNPGAVAYDFTRSPTGWQSAVLTPPANEYPHSTMLAATGEDLETTLWGAAPTDLLYHEDIYLRTRPDGAGLHLVGVGTGPEVAEEELTLSGEELTFVGASENLTHSVFQIEASNIAARESHKDHSNLWPGDKTSPGGHSLYEYLYAGMANPEPTLVGVNNQGLLHGGRINENAELISECGTELGSGARGSAYNAVSKNGEVVFFTALAAEHEVSPDVFRCNATGEGIGPSVNELYARVGDTRTVDVSEPSSEQCEACNTTTGLQGATYQGASQNGEKVFFTTEQELLPGQTGMNLYEYDFASPIATPGHADGKLSLVSACSVEPVECSAKTEVQGVVRVSENGERVYFVAKGKLTGKDLVAGRSEEETGPQEGADNLYVYEPDPAHAGTYHTVFIATLLTPSEEGALMLEEAEEEGKIHEIAEKFALSAYEEAVSQGASEGEAIEIFEERDTSRENVLRGTLGSSGTLADDQSVWQTADLRPAQATPDGGFMVFVTSDHLTAEDKSRVPQLFEYDANDGSLRRISIGENGPSGGNVAMFDEAPRIPIQSFNGVDVPTAAETGLAVSEDGSRVFFTSTAGLTPQAEMGATNVYEYSAGNVYLISGGHDMSLDAGEPTVVLFGIDPSAQSVFFLTADQLVPQDRETQVALYDAREEGGFPEPVLEPGCIGETCRGSLSATPQMQLPGSTSQASVGNLGSSTVKPQMKSAKSLTRVQKLARALRACSARRGRRRRAGCKRRARSRYGEKMNSNGRAINTRKSAPDNRGAAR